MGKIALGLLLGLLIGIGCRWFDIPLPGPPKLIGAVMVLAVTIGYVGMDYLLVSHAKREGSVARPVMTMQYGSSPTGLPPSQEQGRTP